MPDAPFGLTGRERDVLRLLAHGHDAKSAATSLGISVHTVNERLRNARRKTGAGSSRAVARLLVAAEHPEKPVPDDFGLPGAPSAPHAVARHRDVDPDGSRRRRRRWIMPISLVFAAALAGTYAVSHRPAIIAAPRVASTYPAVGAVVAPGPVMVRVTYDRPMRRDSYSFVRRSVATFPDCGDMRPIQSADDRTFALRCRLLPDRRYDIRFNSVRFRHFVGTDGVPAMPYTLTFRTGPTAR